MSHTSNYHIKTEIPLASTTTKIMSSTGAGAGTKMGLQALAEVAIGRLLEEQDEAAAVASTKIINRAYTLKQIRKLSEKKLLTTFTARQKRVLDKNNKRFEYRCTILPHLCQQSFECPAAAAEEALLKVAILKHLNGHLCNLEKSEGPGAKITFRRAVKSRPQAGASAAVMKKEEKSGSTTAVAKKSTSRKGSSAPASAAAVVNSLPAGAVVIGGTGAPLDMSTSSLALKFLEEDHPYTVSTDPALVARSGILTEALNSAGITPDAFPLTPTQPAAMDMEGTGGMVVIDGSSALVVGEQQAQHLQQAQTIPPSSNANVRALALDYIDDIRKKSSSAAKPVLAVNGDKSLIYQCKICPDKQFTSTNGLIFHYKKHAGLKPYVCELCSATFTRQHSLNYHMLIHLNKSRFVCQECGRHFRHPSHFKEHMRRHTGETPFQCADCLIRFKTRNTYKRHLQTKHAKILTSKGIIELSGNTGSGYPEAVASTSGTSVKAIKPRGSKYTSTVKYALAANPAPAPAAAVAVAPTPPQTYEPQQVLSMQLPQQPIDYSQQPQNLSMHHHHEPQQLHHHPHPSTTAATPITIVQLPGVAGVHILDNTGALSAATAVATTTASAEGYHHLHHQQTADHHHQLQPITLVSYHQQPQQLHHHPQLEPIQPSCTATLMNSPPISSGPLTELTSSPALGMHHHQIQQQHQQSMMQQPQPQHHQQPPSNDNFNMLLAAIEMTEDHQPKQELQ